LATGKLLSWHRILKNSFKTLNMKKFVASFLAAFYSTFLLAQEGQTKNVNVDINTDGNSANWYASPWVWVVGAAVFILLLVALTRGGRRAD
jgi:hypothetical protein